MGPELGCLTLEFDCGAQELVRMMTMNLMISVSTGVYDKVVRGFTL